MNVASVDSMQRTGQWLRERRCDVGGGGRQAIKIQTHNARRYKQIFSVCAVEKEQVFTQTELPTPTVETLLTRGRICYNDRIPLFTYCHPCPGGGYYSGYLVTEPGRNRWKRTGCPRRNALRSVPQVVAAATCKRTSPASGCGTGCSSRRRSSGLKSRAASMSQFHSFQKESMYVCACHDRRVNLEHGCSEKYTTGSGFCKPLAV